MTILSAQSIRRLCAGERPLISPFCEGQIVGGLLAFSYACRAADGFVVPVGAARAVVTLERFCLPRAVVATAVSRSPWAPAFVAVVYGRMEPSSDGPMIVELANLSVQAAVFEPGDPLVQVKFEWLDEPTDRNTRGCSHV